MYLLHLYSLVLVLSWGESAGETGNSNTRNSGLKTHTLSHLAYPDTSIVSKL
jgi:hypothetical protein